MYYIHEVMLTVNVSECWTIVTKIVLKVQKQPEACTFIKIGTLAQVFSCEFCEISKKTSLAEHGWATAWRGS